MVDDCDSFEVVKSWLAKSESVEFTMKSAAIKCSPKIHHYLLDTCQGFVYLGMMRCKVYDRLYVVQCHHCGCFNHVSKKRPDKNKRPVCGKCALNHDAKNCRATQPKSAHCVRNKTNEANDYHASPSHCPSVIREKKSSSRKN